MVRPSLEDVYLELTAERTRSRSVSEAVALGWRQFRLERKQFWRNPTAAFFGFLLPIVFLLIIGSLTPTERPRHRRSRASPA